MKSPLLKICFAVLAIAAIAATGLKISDMTETTSLVATNMFETTVGGVGTTRKVYFGTLKSNILAGDIRRQIVATRGHDGMLYSQFPGDPIYSDGLTNKATYRLGHVATAPCWEITASFGNFAGETPGTANILVRASLETTNGVIFPLTFGGRRSVVIEPGGLVESDPCSAVFDKGTPFYSRTYVEAYAGDRWSLCEIALGGAEGVTWNQDLSATGSVAAGVVYTYSPMLISGKCPTVQPTILIIGDSIFRGYASNPYAGPVHALGTNYGENFGHVNIAQGGERSFDFASVSNRIYRAKLAYGCTHALVNYGVNDTIGSRTAVQMSNDLRSVWMICTNMGMLVYQCTITPISTSTDGFVTEGANQTTHANNAARTNVNDWVRLDPAPLSGHMETADAVESARNSGKWKAGYTSDGNHPNFTGVIFYAAAINTNFFRL